MSSYVVKLRGLGRLRGVVEKNIDGGSYLAFKGVPYAKPPLGPLRFADPVPPESWTGIREAAKFGESCAQYNIITEKYGGSEDCLYLNVYVPLIEKKCDTKFPTMVWIHGGGFANGSGNNFFFGPDYLVKKEVIIVSINYRLGVFGFLNLEHRIAPGNQGLKDQVFALRWVQEHIEAFNGDKNNVTIFGESSGASCVHYLSLSPLAEGLFHKAIIQSGTANCPWASTVQKQRSYVIRLLEYLGRPFSNEQGTLDFLKTVECAKLAEAHYKIRTLQELMQLNFLFAPGPDDVADQPFLPNFISSIENGVVKVPLILGYTENEGIFLASYLDKSSCKMINEVGLGWAIHPNASEAVKRNHNLSVSDLKQAYFGDEPLDPEKSLSQYIQMGSDLVFVNAVYDLAQIQARKSEQPTYLYKYSYDNGFSILKIAFSMSRIPGAGHADELFHLFHPHGLRVFGLKSPGKGSQERIAIERLTQMWTDFAKTGTPIPAESEFIKTTWKPIKEANELHYLDIDEELSPGLNPDAARRLLWNRPLNKF